MLSTNYFVHLYFDYDHNIHYTDTMLALEPDAYLWYILRIKHDFSSAIFIEKEHDELKAKTFDGFSKSLMEKKSIFKIMSKVSYENELESSVQTISDAFSIDDILKIPDRKELRGKKIAFIFSLDAFYHVYNNSDKKSIDKLTAKIEAPDGKSIFVLKIPPLPAKIKEAFLEKSSLLPQLSKKIEMALNGVKEPIIEALLRQMREQIIFGYRVDDAFNMLLMIAIKQKDWSDTLEDMKKQASYIQLCYNNYGKLVAKPERNTNRTVFIKHNELYEQLRESEFRRMIRRQTQELTAKYPELSVEDAMKREGLLPEFQTVSIALEYDDPLVRNIKNLSIPVFFRKKEKCAELEGCVARIKKNFTTFWNKPHNLLAYSKAEFFYNYIKNTCNNRDPNTFYDVLKMLDLCGEYLCWDSDKNESLRLIFECGKSMAEISENMFNILKKHGAQDESSFKNICTYTLGLPDKNEYIEQKLELKKDIMVYKKYSDSHSTLKLYINKLGNEIKLNKVSYQEIAKTRLSIIENLKKEIDSIEVQESIDENIEKEIKTISQKQMEDISRDYADPKDRADEEIFEESKKDIISFEDEYDDEFPYEEFMDTGSDPEDGKAKIRDKDFAEKLLRKTLY